MGEHRSLRLDKDQRDAIDDMVDRGRADTKTEAAKKFLNVGMQKYGYTPAGDSNTTLRTMAAEFARLFAYVGVAWIAFFWAFPVEFRLVGVLVVVAALGMVGVYVGLGYVEPDLSRRLFSRGEKA